MKTKLITRIYLIGYGILGGIIAVFGLVFDDLFAIITGFLIMILGILNAMGETQKQITRILRKNKLWEEESITEKNLKILKDIVEKKDEQKGN